MGLAQHLNDMHSPAHIVVVDLSPASLRLCQQRLRARKLTGTLAGEVFGSGDSSVRVTLVVGNLLDIPTLASAIGGVLPSPCVIVLEFIVSIYVYVCARVFVCVWHFLQTTRLII